MSASQNPNRRDLLTGGLAVVALGPAALAASAATLDGEMARVLAGRKPTPGRVTVTLPELAENGQSVPITVAVDSPMTAGDRVRHIDIFSEKNPVNHVCRIRLSARSGRAKVATNMRLADGQRVIAVAEMVDGSLWSGGADIVVTQPACIDDSVQ